MRYFTSFSDSPVDPVRHGERGNDDLSSALFVVTSGKKNSKGIHLKVKEEMIQSSLCTSHASHNSQPMAAFI